MRMIKIGSRVMNSFDATENSRAFGPATRVRAHSPRDVRCVGEVIAALPALKMSLEPIRGGILLLMSPTMAESRVANDPERS